MNNWKEWLGKRMNDCLPDWATNWPTGQMNEGMKYTVAIAWMGLTDQRMQTNADFSDKLMLSKEKCNCLSHNVVTLDVDHNVCTVNC